MFLSRSKIANIKLAEQRTFKFYYENLLNSYKVPEGEYKYKKDEIPGEWFCLLHLVDPICHAIKLIINLSRFLVSLIDLVACYLSGDKKEAKTSALENTKNTCLLTITNFANIIISVFAFLPRLIKTFVDIFSENKGLITTDGYSKENKFFNNILDVLSNNVPGSQTKHTQVVPNTGIFVRATNIATKFGNQVWQQTNSATYDPGF